MYILYTPMKKCKKKHTATKRPVYIFAYGVYDLNR